MEECTPSRRRKLPSAPGTPRRMPSIPPPMTDGAQKQRSQSASATTTSITTSMSSSSSISSPIRHNVYGRKVSLSMSALPFFDEAEEPVDTRSQNVIVSVRVRPFNEREENMESPLIISMSGRSTNIVNPMKGKAHTFHYDHSFWSHKEDDSNFVSQERVYKYLGEPLLDRCLEGYNCSLFAYGQTGSGKSYSMMGIPGSYVTVDLNSGIIPRFTNSMFTRMHELEKQGIQFKVEVSYYEIYSERIYDLLTPPSKGKMHQLRVREHPIMGPYVEGLKTFAALSFDDIEGWLNVGSKHRATASTNMNATSSRSHAVFTMVVTQSEEDEEGEEHSKVSKVNLVDLAGSERSDVAGTSGVRLREGSAINKSLHTLGKVISLLADRSTSKKNVFIPYRDSVLTWILKESLGGNAKTAMLATLSPALTNYDETLSTLRYAHQARQIVNVAQVNEDPNARLISDLRHEIELLRGQVTGKGNVQEVAALRDKLRTTQSIMAAMNRTWEEKLRIAEQSRLENTLELSKRGVDSGGEAHLPKLINLNEDPQLSEMILYSLNEGDVIVGNNDDADVQLGGALVLPKHCTLHCDENTNKAEETHSVFITVEPEALVFVNGHGIDVGARTQLHHSDRVIFGNNHYFRLTVPRRKDGERTVVPHTERDFAFAKEEYEHVQAEKLRQLIAEESERQAQIKREEWEQELEKQKLEYEQNMKELQDKINLKQRENEHLKEIAEKTQHSLKAEEQSNKALGDELEMLQKEKEKLEHSQNLFKNENEKYKQQITSVKSMMQQEKPYSMNIGGAFFATTQTFNEANRIAKKLGQHTVFTMARENGNPMVKVVNTELKVSTLWAIEKYDEKLDEMRQLYTDWEAEGEVPDGVDQVFFDPNDEWMAESMVEMHEDEMNVRRRSSSNRFSLDPTAFASYDFSSARGGVATVRRRAKTPAKELNDAYNAEPPVTALACNYIRNISKCITEETQRFSLTHELVSSLSSLKIATTLMVNAFETHTAKKDAILKLCDTGIARNTSISVTLAMNAISFIVRSLRSQGDTGPVLELTQRLASSTEGCCNNLIKLMQGIDNEIPSMVVSGHSGCESDIMTMSTIGGELAIVLEPQKSETEAAEEEEMDDDGRAETLTRLTMVSKLVAIPVGGRQRSSTFLDAKVDEVMNDQEAVDVGVLRAFYAGTQTYVQKTFENCKQDLNSLPVKIDEMKRSLTDASPVTVDVLDAAQQLAIKTVHFIFMSEALQNELTYHGSGDTDTEAVKRTFYNKNFTRTKGVISQVQGVTDAVMWLVDSCGLVCVGQDDIAQLMSRGQNIRTTVAHLLSAAEFKTSQQGKGHQHILSLRDEITHVYGASTTFQHVCEDLLSKKASQATSKQSPHAGKKLGVVQRQKLLMENKAEIIRLENELKMQREYVNHLNQAGYNFNPVGYNTATSDI
eukprot:m.11337 g.11337  ORF g.11337 m.11337 type:complete len:1428 (+) comp3821_c0_seq1:81-4364(+)